MRSFGTSAITKARNVSRLHRTPASTQVSLQRRTDIMLRSAAGQPRVTMVRFMYSLITRTGYFSSSVGNCGRLTTSGKRTIFSFLGVSTLPSFARRSRPNSHFADVVGKLEGESTVGGSIRASPPFIYRREPMRNQPEEVPSWGDILRRLRDRLRETSHSHVRISTRS
jgi:hypothetical protein